MSTKVIADILTASRFGSAWVLLWIGTSKGAEGLPLAVIILVIAWITDVLDGPLARREPSRAQTWVGEHDLEIDIAVSLGVMTYLVFSNYLSAWLAVSYVVLCALVLWRYRSLELAWAVQAPPYGGMLYIALCHAPIYGLLMLAYLVIILVATWPRFPQVTLPQFFSAMRSLQKTEISPEPSQEETPLENSNKSSQA